MPGLHICNVNTRGSDPRGEFVEIANDGGALELLTGLKLTDYTATQAHPHIYQFPTLQDGSGLFLKPGQEAYVFTGLGTSELSTSGDWLLFAQRNDHVWNDDGDVAYLRQSNGQLIDTRTVGQPRRHPNGH